MVIFIYFSKYILYRIMLRGGDMKEEEEYASVNLDDIEGVDHERAAFIRGYLKAEMIS